MEFELDEFEFDAEIGPDEAGFEGGGELGIGCEDEEEG